MSTPMSEEHSIIRFRTATDAVYELDAGCQRIRCLSRETDRAWTPIYVDALTVVADRPFVIGPGSIDAVDHEEVTARVVGVTVMRGCFQDTVGTA